MSKEQRPPISEIIKREVRQRCGFGCVICGLPLYEYHHIVPWEKVKIHEAKNLTLLCDSHHKMVGNLLPDEKIIRDNSNPINLRKGWSSDLELFFEGDKCKVCLGNNFFYSNFKRFTYSIPIVIDGFPIIMFELIDGMLFFSIRLNNRANNLVLEIVRNELSYSVSPWDISLIGNTLTIRERLNDVFIRMRINLPNEIVIDSAHIYFNGIELNIKPKRIMVTGDDSNFQKNIVEEAPFGISIGGNSPIGALTLGEIPRFPVKKMHVYNS